MVSLLNNRRGQTMVEWLLLMAASFITAYLVITGPIANFTVDFLAKLQRVTNNVVLTGESKVQTPPSDPKRFKPVHL